MPYNNGFRGNYSNRGNYNNGYQRSNSYGGSFQGRSFGGQRQQKKHSGATAGQGKNGKPYVRGWRWQRSSGLVTFFAAPYHGTKQTTSESGRVWENWILKVTTQSGSYIKPCLYDLANRKVICQDLSLVMNPKGGRGGYSGRNFIRK